MTVKNVMVVDSDDAIIKLFLLIGKRMRVKTLHSPNGAEAFTKFKNQDFDLIITELDLPKMNGIELIRKVRKDAKHKKFNFIVITKNLSVFQQELKEFKNITILEKPIKVKTIEDLYENLLDASLAENEVLNIEEIQNSLITSFKLSSTILLEYTTKDRPKVKQMEKFTEGPIIKSNYVLNYPVFIGGNHLTLVFEFDKSLAQSIKSNIMKDKIVKTSENTLILGTLKKLMGSFIKKLFENSGNFVGFNSVRHNSLLGSLDKKAQFFIDNRNHCTAVRATNKYGSFTMHVLKEA